LSVGEGALWVIDEGGPLENGDLITVSSVVGYATKKQDDIINNTVVGKVTTDCDFNQNVQVKRVPKIIQKLKGMKKVLKTITKKVKTKKVIYNEELDRHIEVESEEEQTENEKCEYPIYNLSGEIIRTEKKDVYEDVEEFEEEIVFDESGNVVWEDVFDESGNTVYVNNYNIKYINSDGEDITEEEYNTLKEQNIPAYKCAYLGMVFYCG